MKQVFQKVIKLPITSVIIISGLLLMVISSCQKETRQTVMEEIPTSTANKSLKDFTQVNLVGDNDEYSPAHMDANLVNAWGISFPTSGPAWVSAEGTGKSAIYSGEGIAAGISPVSIPGAGSSTVGHPTGQVFNGSTTDFKLPNHNPARFIFAGADGVISGWNGGSAAIKMIDDSPDASYLGIALAAVGSDHFLYAANFAEGKIDVYDTAWHEVSKPFTDPNLPAGYSPFNIQNVGGKLYVMYAKVGPGGDEIHHEGFGIVDIYNPDGSFVKRFISFGQLNSPWGIAMAPAGFWGDGADVQDVILVGNFGDGRINAYNSD
ncbi:MAG TPA: TIGR03118 family protein, partial [Chitinophagaceae bacterium]|nr:TIGR03118 family protein [Chitinophagaceae bacterium]